MSFGTAIINWAQTSDTGGGNLALINLSTPFKLLRVEVHGTVSHAVGNLPPTGVQFDGSLMWGIQAIPHGNTPLALPNNITAADWLVVEAQRPTEVTAAWSPNSSTAAVATAGGFSLRWAGQMAFGASTDILFTDGQATGFTNTWESFGTMKVWYN
jgi:hypothetical protein